MNLVDAKNVLDSWYNHGSTGELRIVIRPDRSLRAGQELCCKLLELPEEAQNAVKELARQFRSPRFEVVCIGRDFAPDRVYLYRPL